MKKVIAVLLALTLLVSLGVTTAFAGKGDGDPKVGYRVINSDCSVPAGEYGYFITADWWWATYPNGVSILKCMTKLGPDQTPPSEVMTIPVGLCSTPDGTTDIAYTKVFPDGGVHLICKLR